MVIYSYPDNRPKDANNGDFYISTSETQSTKIAGRSYFDSVYIAKSGKLKTVITTPFIILYLFLIFNT